MDEPKDALSEDHIRAIGALVVTLVGHPSRSPGVLLFCVIILAFFAGRSTSALLISVRLWETAFYLGRHFRIFLWPEIALSRKQRNRLRRLWPEDEMLLTLFGGTGQKSAPIGGGCTLRNRRSANLGRPCRVRVIFFRQAALM